MRYVFATLACLVLVIVVLTINALMEWKAGGGVIVVAIEVAILLYTWNAIVKKGEKNNQIGKQKEGDLNSSKKDGNTHNIARSDNAPEIVSKPFKTKIIKPDSDIENTKGDEENTTGDEEFYLIATEESEGEGLDEALWAKCLAIFKGDEKKAKYDYIEKRVTIFREEIEEDRKDSRLKKRLLVAVLLVIIAYNFF